MKVKRLWQCPKNMGEHGKKLWKNVGPLLVESGSLDQLDRETFETLCRCFHKMTMADIALEREGPMADDNRGAVKKSPLFTQWRAYSDLYIRLLSHFGLSPHSRGMKIKPHEQEKDNGKQRFFK